MEKKNISCCFENRKSKFKLLNSRKTTDLLNMPLFFFLNQWELLLIQNLNIHWGVIRGEGEFEVIKDCHPQTQNCSM